MLARALRWIAIGLAILWVLALAVFAVGTFGLFGQERDPISGVYLMLVGMPWSRLVDVLPQSLWPIALALAPGISVLIIWIAYLAARSAGRRT